MAPNQEDKLDVRRQWSEVLKNVVQVAAIIVGGYWTWYKFIRTEAPALETRADVSSEITWYPSPIPKSCYAHYSIHIQNVGQSSFTVDSVHIRAWQFELSLPQNSSAKFVDLHEIEKGPTFFDQNYRSTILLGIYSPGVKANDTVSWIVRRVPNSLVLFKTEFYLNQKGEPRSQKPVEETESWDTQDWEAVCGT